MHWIFYFLFASFSFSAFSFFPVTGTHKSFLEHEKKQKQFKNKRKNILRARLKQLEKTRRQKETLQIQKAFLEYKEKQKKFENYRKKAFLAYKKQYKKYRTQKESILEARLKKLKSFRTQIKQESFQNIKLY